LGDLETVSIIIVSSVPKFQADLPSGSPFRPVTIETQKMDPDEGKAVDSTRRFGAWVFLIELPVVHHIPTKLEEFWMSVGGKIKGI